jgi:glycosyltransferase involved in cell wall biosynthesis
MSAHGPAPLRVLHVTPYFAPAFCYGGPPRSILGLCRSLKDLGVRVAVYTTTANGEHDLDPSVNGNGEYAGVPTRYFPRAFPRRFFGAAGLDAALRASIGGFDLVHIHGLWNLPAWTAAHRAHAAGAPYVLSPRGMLEPGALALRSWRKRLVYPLVQRRHLERAALLHATGAAEAERLRHAGRGVDVVMLPNGVELPPADGATPGAFRARLGLGDAPLIVFLGRLHPIKRLDVLAAAYLRLAGRHAGARFVVAGPDEGDHRRVVAPLFAPLGDRMYWTGALDESEKWSLLADAEVLVLCSASENFGMSAAEAMAAGVPVVVTRTCPWQDVETHRCGFWVDSDPDAIAAAVTRVLADPSGAREMGARGRALIRDKYSWPAIARAMTKEYATIVSRRAVASVA